MPNTGSVAIAADVIYVISLLSITLVLAKTDQLLTATSTTLNRWQQALSDTQQQTYEHRI